MPPPFRPPSLFKAPSAPHRAPRLANKCRDTHGIDHYGGKDNGDEEEPRASVGGSTPGRCGSICDRRAASAREIVEKMPHCRVAALHRTTASTREGVPAC